jgi:hypothetical protein
MNDLQNRNSRNPSSFTIPAGESRPVAVNGDYCWLYSTTGEVEIAVNDGDFAPCPVGLIHRGVIGRDDIGRVQIKNVTGSAVDVVMVYGKGSMDISGQVSIINPTFGLETADLLALTPAPVTGGPGFAQLDNADDDFDGCNSISIENTGAANLTVTTSEGALVIPPGKFVSWSMPRPQDDLGAINVDATGTTADVTYLINP